MTPGFSQLGSHLEVIGTKNVKQRNVIVSSAKAGSKEFFTITDIETGEILSQYWQQTKSGEYRPPPNGKQPNFYKVYATNWQRHSKTVRC